MNHGTDEDRWVERLRGEDPQRSEAIAELRKIILRGLTRSLNQRYGSPFQAEDVVQESLIRILDSLDSFEGRSRFTTWAMTVATRVGISALRRRYTQDISLDAMRDDSDGQSSIVVDQAASTEDQINRSQILEQLAALLQLISTADSDALDCDECFSHIAEFADRELASLEIPQALQAVENHLRQCPCCRDEYQALLEGLRSMQSPNSSSL